MTCNRDMSAKSKADHLAGKPHQQRVKQVAGGSNCMSGNGGYLPACYADDLSEDDARSILEDIDTQWGLLPRGGAYKESGEYYGDT